MDSLNIIIVVFLFFSFIIYMFRFLRKRSKVNRRLSRLEFNFLKRQASKKDKTSNAVSVDCLAVKSEINIDCRRLMTSRQIDIVSEVSRISEIYGYSVGIDRFLKDRIQLIAVPWIDTACAAEELVNQLCSKLSMDIVTKSEQLSNRLLFISLRFKEESADEITLSIVRLNSCNDYA